MSNAQVAEIARQLGHTHVELYELRGRWGAQCDCGWKSREPYWRVVEAISEGQYHLRKAAKEHLENERRNGRVSLIAKAGSGR